MKARKVFATLLVICIALTLASPAAFAADPVGYEFRDSLGISLTPTPEADDWIPIGTSQQYTVFALYGDGTEEKITDLSRLNFSVDDNTVFTFVTPSSGSSLLTVNATKDGGSNDARYGNTAVVNVSDTDGVSGAVTLALDYSLINSIIYYAETADGVQPYSAGDPTKTIIDQAGLTNGHLEIPRGLSADVWIVPVFTNETMYTPGPAIDPLSNWQDFALDFSDVTFTGSKFSAPGAMSTVNPGALMLDTGINDSVPNTLASSEAWNSTINVQYSINGSVFSNGRPHDIDPATGLSSLSVDLDVCITAPVVTRLDVELYNAATDTYSSIYNTVTGTYDLSGEVGDELIIRVKAIYSDGHSVDQLGTQGSNVYSQGGAYFLHPTRDTVLLYTAGNGPTDPWSAISNPADLFSNRTNADLTVLQGYLMSRNPQGYFVLANNTGGSHNVSAEDWADNLTAQQQYSILSGLTGDIAIHDRPNTRGFHGVSARWLMYGANYIPGHYRVTLIEPGAYTLDFSGTYRANGFDTETQIRGISSSQELKINVLVEGAPCIPASGGNKVINVDLYTIGYADRTVELNFGEGIYSANGITSITADRGATPLISGTDYTLSGTTLTIKNAYLTGLTTGVSPITLTVTFDDTASSTDNITIAVTDTKPPLYTAGGGGGTTYFSVTFNSGGGSSVSVASVASGGTAAKPADPARDGYTFGGWYSDAACTLPYDFTEPVTGNISLYAKWTPVGASPFNDVKTTDWFYDAVMYIYECGLMIGVGDDLFDPYSSLSRGMIVTILYRLAGEPDAGGLANPFSDVPGGQYYTDAVRWAAANGIVLGYNETSDPGGRSFGPDDNITREQLAVILFRYMVMIGEGPHGAWMIHLTFADLADVSEWAAESVAYLYLRGIVNGRTGNVFDPQGAASRAEAAAMLYRWLTAA